jgi:hypothetical protein
MWGLLQEIRKIQYSYDDLNKSLVC